MLKYLIETGRRRSFHVLSLLSYFTVEQQLLVSLRLPPLVLVVPPAVLAAQRCRRALHPGGTRALHRGRGRGLFHHLPPVLVVPHHGQLTGETMTEVHHRSTFKPLKLCFLFQNVVCSLSWVQTEGEQLTEQKLSLTSCRL